jgi:hypothetical protein
MNLAERRRPIALRKKARYCLLISTFTVLTNIGLTIFLTNTKYTTLVSFVFGKNHTVILSDTNTCSELPAGFNSRGNKLPSQPASCTVILRESLGRLGNRMFMFASAYGLARTHGCNLYVDDQILKELSSVFQIRIPLSVTKGTITQFTNITKQYCACRFFNHLLLPYAIKRLELIGFWQAYGYFIKYTEELRHQFTILDYQIRTVRHFVQYSLRQAQRCYGEQGSNCSLSQLFPHNLTLQSPTFVNMSFYRLKAHLVESSFVWIGIHVRRTDIFVVNGGMYDDIYVRNAISYFTKKYSNSIFLLTSDDKLYCIQQLANLSNIIVTPLSFSPAQDLAILALCQHTIVTAGSFGWWAAFLAGGDVYHDVQYTIPTACNTDNQQCVCPKDAYYPPWFIFARNFTS